MDLVNDRALPLQRDLSLVHGTGFVIECQQVDFLIPQAQDCKKSRRTGHNRTRRERLEEIRLSDGRNGAVESGLGVKNGGETLGGCRKRGVCKHVYRCPSLGGYSNSTVLVLLVRDPGLSAR